PAHLAPQSELSSAVFQAGRATPARLNRALIKRPARAVGDHVSAGGGTGHRLADLKEIGKTISVEIAGCGRVEGDHSVDRFKTARVFHFEKTIVRVQTGRIKIRSQFAIDCRGSIQAAQVQLDEVVRRTTLLNPKGQTVETDLRRLRAWQR